MGGSIAAICVRRRPEWADPHMRIPYLIQCYKIRVLPAEGQAIGRKGGAHGRGGLEQRPADPTISMRCVPGSEDVRESASGAPSGSGTQAGQGARMETA